MDAKSGCEQRGRVFLLFAGTVGPDEQDAIGRHISDCVECQRVFEQLASETPIPRADDGVELFVDGSVIHDIMDSPKQEAAKDESPPADAWQIADAAPDRDCRGMIGDYEVTGLLGRGGMGAVFKARDTKLNRVVAIKVLLPELAAQSSARHRFYREAQAAAAVSHLNVVAIHAVEDGWKYPFFVMEYIRGQTLQEKIDREGPLSVDEVLRIGRQMAAGLSAAHDAGIVHRDLKPANVLLENGICRVKISDFGLARSVEDPAVTRFGQIVGTPRFMAPEQADGRAVDHRADLFAVGSILYTMCTARPPFSGDDALSVLRNVCDSSPERVDHVNQMVPEWLGNVVETLLQKDPDDRFQSAEELSARLIGGTKSSGGTSKVGAGRPRLKKFGIPLALVGLLLLASTPLLFNLAHDTGGDGAGFIGELQTAEVTVVEGSGRFLPLQPGLAMDSKNPRNLWYAIPPLLKAQDGLEVWQIAAGSGNSKEGRIKFRALTDGWIVIAVTNRFGGGGSMTEQMVGKLTSRDDLVADGWRVLVEGMSTKVIDSSYEERFTVFHKAAKAGDTFDIRTEKYIPPLLIRSRNSED